MSTRQTMRVLDPKHILPNEEQLRRAVAQHPLYPMLEEWLEVRIAPEPDGFCQDPAHVRYDRQNRSAFLSIASELPRLPEYEYVLLHEFTHVGDRVDPSFGFSDGDRDAMSNKEALKFNEIWNVYIDSRLNEHNKFVLGKHDRGICCTINDRLQLAPYSIEGKLLRHASFLRSRGMPKADEIVREIWRFPDRKRTFSELMRLTNDIAGKDTECRSIDCAP